MTFEETLERLRAAEKRAAKRRQEAERSGDTSKR